MALGGGSWTVQNKVLPGTYINFASAAMATATISDRGVVTMPLSLDWGASDQMITVSAADFIKNSLKIFGYAYDADELKGLRDLFATGARTLYAYRLNGGGEKASCDYCAAKYAGTRGNDLKVVIAANTEAGFDVAVYLGTTKVFEQLGAENIAALEACDYVDWTATATLAETAGTALTGGTNNSVTGTDYQAYLDKAESYAFNAMGAAVTDATTKGLFAAYCKRMRDERGAKFQCVLYDYADADYEGIISVMNKATDGATEADLVYWATGAEGACEVNATLLNQKYTGEYTVYTDYTQSQLEAAIQAGKFAFHSVNGDVRVLADINTLVSDTSDKAKNVFCENQTIRVIDQIANDIATLFNTRYLGVIPNDAAGRTSLWNDVCKLHQQLESIRAIEDFDPDSVTVEQGDTKKSVVCTVSGLNIVNAMAQLYMSVVVI